MDQEIAQYFQLVSLSRNTINNALSIIREQERSLRDIINIRINHNPSTRNYYQSFMNRNTPPEPTENPFYDIPRNYTSTPFNTRRIPHPPRNSTTQNYRSSPPRYPETIINYDNLSPVRVAPTLEQLALGSRVVRFDEIENPVNTECPIIRDPFGESDRVTQINHCSHIFSTASFNRWFRNNVTCPVCRHDIRNPNTNTNPNTNPNTNTNTDATTNTNTNTNTDATTNTHSATSNDYSLNTSIARPNSSATTLHLQNNSIENIVDYITQDIRPQLDTNRSSAALSFEYGLVMPSSGIANNIPSRSRNRDRDDASREYNYPHTGIP